jgi:hypothetical protein
MSLFAPPVSATDLTELQQGIEFFTDTNEATTEAGLINQTVATETVSSYALRLLTSNISLSQVAMAVDSLMFGVTDSVTELAKLSTQFLPAQVATAGANGFNPTVYAAEALGLALAAGNGTSDNFSTDFGSLSVFDFALEISNIIGVNAAPIEGFVNNWINFYTANPSATFGLSVTLASYGAAFGDAVGAALLNPTVNGTLALLASEVQNALIDNAEGLYTPNISLSSETPHTPFEGEAVGLSGKGTFDWNGFGNYAQFTGAQIGDIIINDTPSTFTLDTQNFGDGHSTIQINPTLGNGDLFTLVVGHGTTFPEILGRVFADGYSTVEVVAVGGLDSMSSGVEVTGNLVISGNGNLKLGDTTPFSVIAQTITDSGTFVGLILGTTNAEKIDASTGGFLEMIAPADSSNGLTVLGGAMEANLLQGSLGPLSPIHFTNGSTGMVASTFVGHDNITGGIGGGDLIYPEGGQGSIILPSGHGGDTVIFGEDQIGDPGANSSTNDILAITDGSDQAYLGSWAVGTTPTPIPNLFQGNTGGASDDEILIDGFRAGSGSGHDQLDFTAAAWNGESSILTSQGRFASPEGDLVTLNGLLVVPAGVAQLSAPWTNSGSNGSLKASDNVLLYVPSDASLQNAQQLAAQLQTSSDAVVLPDGGSIGPGQHKHILVAYDASFVKHGTTFLITNIADVDLVNNTSNAQTSTANLNVYASDMVSLLGASLSSLTPDNIHFI